MFLHFPHEEQQRHAHKVKSNQVMAPFIALAESFVAKAVKRDFIVRAQFIEHLTNVRHVSKILMVAVSPGLCRHSCP
jgi:hypothetical protein